MLTIQILIDLFALYAISRVVLKMRNRSLTAGWGAFWLFFWIATGVVVSLPWTTSLLALRLGVTRGVDLVMYVALLGLFWLFFRMTLKIEKLEHIITTVVREAALNKSQAPSTKSQTISNDQNPK